MSTQSTEILRQYLSSVSKLDPDHSLSMFAADATVSTPMMDNRPLVMPMAAAAEAYRKVYSLFAELKWSELSIYGTDDPELAIARCTGTGKCANGRPYQNFYAIFLRARNGKIVELTEFFSPTRSAVLFEK